MKFSSLAALKVVILTTFSAASDEDFVKMTTFLFQCILADLAYESLRIAQIRKDTRIFPIYSF